MVSHNQWANRVTLQSVHRSTTSATRIIKPVARPRRIIKTPIRYFTARWASETVCYFVKDATSTHSESATLQNNDQERGEDLKLASADLDAMITALEDATIETASPQQDADLCQSDSIVGGPQHDTQDVVNNDTLIMSLQTHTQ